MPRHWKRLESIELVGGAHAGEIAHVAVGAAEYRSRRLVTPATGSSMRVSNQPMPTPAVYEVTVYLRTNRFTDCGKPIFEPEFGPPSREHGNT